MGELRPHRDAALTVDPLNPCPPVGCMYAAFGIHRGLPLSHGASGCCRFQRMELSKHFQKVVHVPSTMLRDRAAAFGGEPELVEAVGNAFGLYDPDVLVVGTTCLSETMGDDLDGIVRRLEVPAGKRVVWASTPGYGGSHLKGYAATVSALVRQVGGGDAVRVPRDPARLLLLPGWMNPCDVGVARRYAAALFDQVTVLPDVRGVFDVRSPGDPASYPTGGTPLREVETLRGCGAVLALGYDATHGPADAARGVCGTATPVREAMLPVGISATDELVGLLSDLAGRPVPAWIVAERERLIDCVAQVASDLYGKRVLVCCDADLAAALALFACDVGMVPAFVAVGDAERGFEARLRGRVGLDAGRFTVLTGVDRLSVEECVRTRPVDVVLGDTRNKRLAARLGVPLVRVGFPVVDRPLAYTQAIAGYTGALDLVRRIVEVFHDGSERGVAPEDLAISRFF